jgi:hypothetical protein
MFSSLTHLSQTMTWKMYEDCTTYNSGSPDGTLADWDFFPLLEDFISVPYDDSAQTYTNGVWSPGFNMISKYAYWNKSFGLEYNDKDFSNYNYYSFQADGYNYIVRPTWFLGCSPAPDIDTDIQQYYINREPGLKVSGIWSGAGPFSYIGIFDHNDPWIYNGYTGYPQYEVQKKNKFVDGDVRYVVLKSGTSYTMKLRSIFGRRQIVYGYGSATNFWYHSTYDIAHGYYPTSIGSYGLQDIWSMYQGAGTTEFRLKTTAKSSLNL